MPQRTCEARLAPRVRKGRDPVYVIRDEGRAEISTGTADRAEAEAALAQ